MGIFSTLESFNKGTFDQHRSTGTVAFSLLICLGITKFVLLGIFTLTYRHKLPDYVCKQSTSLKMPLVKLSIVGGES